MLFLQRNYLAFCPILVLTSFIIPDAGSPDSKVRFSVPDSGSTDHSAYKENPRDKVRIINSDITFKTENLQLT